MSSKKRLSPNVLQHGQGVKKLSIHVIPKCFIIVVLINWIGSVVGLISRSHVINRSTRPIKIPAGNPCFATVWVLVYVMSKTDESIWCFSFTFF